MPTPANEPANLLRQLARLALALTIVALAASEASAQHEGPFAGRNRRFYGPDYDARGYADSLGLRGHKRLENGGYYGSPQIYSRQYGTVFGFRRDRPFEPIRNYGANAPN